MKQYLLLCLALSLLVGCKDIPANITVSNKVITESSIRMDVLGEDVDGIKQCAYSVHESGQTPTYKPFDNVTCGTLFVSDLNLGTAYEISLRLESLNQDTGNYQPTYLSVNAVTLSAINIDLIKDENLKKYVADMQDKNISEIIEMNLSSTHSPIESIAGIEQFSALTSLSIGASSVGNESTGLFDLTPLAKLTNLKKLTLRNNDVSNITPLAGLINLTELNLTESKISDITPLKNLTNLVHLDVRYNQLSDLSPLNHLTSLQFLALKHNGISNITPLASLTDLRHLYLNGNQIADIQPLSSLTKLTSLQLIDNQVIDVKPLTGLIDLIYLMLDANQISDITPLQTLENLKVLDLEKNTQIQCNDVLLLRGKLPNTSLYHECIE